MMRIKIVRLFTIFIAALTFFYVSIFFIYPQAVIEIYRGADEKTIWAKMKHLQFKKEISGTNSYKFPDLQWSPDKKHLAFYDFTRKEIFKKEWELKIFNPRTFQTKVIFIGDYKTGKYRWIENNAIRAYEGGGSGVRIYRDISIDIAEPFIASDHMSPKYWTPEKM